MRVPVRELCDETAVYDCYWLALGGEIIESYDCQVLRTRWARGIISGSILGFTFERQEKIVRSVR